MKTSKTLPIWRLRAKADRRFRSGHPWVYSNELQESPKGIEPGALVELHDAAGIFLARGFGNPSSLIAFRALSRDAADLVDGAGLDEVLIAKLRSAQEARHALGLANVSYRLCFGEADWLPGLVIDRYLLSQGEQVLVVQPHSAGMDRACANIVGILKAVSDPALWEKTAIVLRRDMSVRKLEGLTEAESEVLKSVSGLDLANVKIRIASSQGLSGQGSAPIELSTDLAGGQKTGFFLDQAANVQLAAQKFRDLPTAEAGKIRILDLCCYVGQWGAQLTAMFRARGLAVEVVAVDASAQALERARTNIEAQGGKCTPLKTDVLKGLGELPDRSFDLVICDPPALIKGRKDVPAGTHAYLTLNTQVFRLVRRGGGVVSCSCSALLEEEEFVKTLSKAAYRNRASVRWIARGSQAPDHPMLLEFPEGRYLKSWFGYVSK